MYRFMDVPVRTVRGGVGTHHQAAGESLSVGKRLPDRSSSPTARRSFCRMQR
jgi:hypothetical protein